MSNHCVLPWSAISLAKQKGDVHHALKGWNKPDKGSSPFAGLRIFRTLRCRAGITARQATNQILQGALDELVKRYEAGATILTRQFLNEEVARVIQNSLNIEEAEYFRRQKMAREMLAEIIQNMELNARMAQRVEQVTRLGSLLPQMLVGADETLNTLHDLLITSGLPYLVALKGMGGIGKTALALTVVRRMIDEDIWDDIAWVTAKTVILTPGGHLKHIEQAVLTVETLLESLFEQLLPNLRKPEPFTNEAALALLEPRLKECPCLCVLDNLETLENIDDLLPLLRRLMNPSKFLLTTRHFLDDATGTIAHIEVPELNEYDTLRLVRQTALEANLRQVLAASNDELRPIYEIAGGNPLAIRLVTGQLQTYTLGEALDDLKQMRGETTENLYTFLYKRAWDHLDEQARLVLLAMPLLNEQGGEIEALQHITQLPPGQLRTALGRLTARSLVNSSGDLHRRIYSIHNLTRTWLCNDLLQWR